LHFLSLSAQKTCRSPTLIEWPAAIDRISVIDLWGGIPPVRWDEASESRRDRDWSNSTSGERQRGGVHKARYDADGAAIPRGTAVVCTLSARGPSRARGYHRCQEELLSESPDYRGSRVTSNVSRISIQFHQRNVLVFLSFWSVSLRIDIVEL